MKLSELDWRTPLKKIDLVKHKRILICVVTCGVSATVIFQALFPHVLWFSLFWAGGTTGATIGLFFGSWWQLHNKHRRPLTSGLFIVTAGLAWGAMATITIFFFVPDFTQQEKILADIQSITVDDVLFVHVRQGEHSKRIKDVEFIKAFVKCARKAELFYPSHESSLYEFEIDINRKHKSISYNAYIPAYHQNDFAIQFMGPSVQSEIIFPGGKKWLEMILPKSASVPNTH